MTPSEQPAQSPDVTDAFAEDLAADSRERAVGALLKIPALRRLWSAQLTGAVADRLGLLALLVLTVQAVAASGSFGGGYRGIALATAGNHPPVIASAVERQVIAVRILVRQCFCRSTRVNQVCGTKTREEMLCRWAKRITKILQLMRREDAWRLAIDRIDAVSVRRTLPGA